MSNSNPFYLALALLFFTMPLFAQKMGFGFYLGPTISKLRFEQVVAADVTLDPYTYKFGYTGGAFVSFPIADNVAVRTELNYERKGGESALLLSDGHGNPLPGKTVKDNFDYLQLPVLFQLSAGEDFKMFIHAGYAFGYLVHYNVDFPKEINIRISTEPPTTYTLQMPPSYKKVDHILVLGAGFSKLMDSGYRFQLALRAFNGRLNIGEGQSAFEARNFSASLTAGLEF